ncbi:pyridoxamine 5'-phosphate oxidase family protein [Nocardia transvalensis]|uniref:pyridoxamine 5'-phosphate oxidase family protein n=1 Tax=Nocardia transvalensis TaxID=37333 RepID=UPI001895904C|nr:pyridoxamine 5'-phosphate oxidase family protein [Nocardia transvalensis]MBF6327731.1 pyridoxamine 5'-phosphate oxidase family protein [Nocardia transvalensis]
MEWAAFEKAAPALARRVRDGLARSGFGLVGTIRRDGTPRISPVEVHLVGAQLMLVMVADTQKVRDLVRDPRVLVQTPVTDPDTPEDEIALRGRVHEITDAQQRVATAETVHAHSGWRPRDSWRLFAVDLDSVSCMQWRNDELRLMRWDTAHGLRPTERRRLDMEASRYVPIGQ